MQVARKYWLIFNPDKCEIRTPRIKFFGCPYDAAGVHPDPDKVEDIQALPAPQIANEIQQVLGLGQYLSSFIPKLTDCTETLRSLTQKDSDWQWTASNQKVFENVRSLVSTECTLTYFNPDEPTILQVTLGAALLQNGKPIAFASKALTATELTSNP